MKLYIKIFMIALIFTGCDKDKPTFQGIDCLPPATQTGAGTFGCLVNGVPYVDNSGRFNCFYQLVNGEYRFNLSPNFERKLFNELDIGCRNVNFTTTQSFDLAISTDGGGAATWFIGNELRDISTNLNYNGMCQITNFSSTTKIISGIFEFKIFDEVKQTLNVITEGRFDAKFTQ